MFLPEAIPHQERDYEYLLFWLIGFVSIGFASVTLVRENSPDTARSSATATTKVFINTNKVHSMVPMTKKHRDEQQVKFWRKYRKNLPERDLSGMRD